MLLLGARLIGTPIMGLQTGTRLAQAARPIINPNNLAIVAYEVEGPLLDETPSFIRIADVRELSNIGMIIDSSDEFIGKDDVIKIRELYELNFRLVGMNVIDDQHHKLGKVEDYILDTDSFIIQQLTVRGGLFKSLVNTSKTIHRSQIVEINSTTIVVKSATTKKEPVTGQPTRNYTNPFRTPQAPQPESTSVQH